MSKLQALLLAAVQGATELFPVSSLGHAVILPAILAWQIDQRAPSFLPFLVALHVGTAAALTIYFWKDWMRIFVPVVRSLTAYRLVLNLVIASAPAALLGYLFEGFFRQLFGSPSIVALCLVVNGFILWAGDRLLKAGQGAARAHALGDIRWKDALVFGIFQSAALMPGLSRSGLTIIGGLVRGFDHETSAEFSFLMATPIILGAALLELPKAARGLAPDMLGFFALCGVVAGVVAYLSTWALMRYFRAREFRALLPFARYCWAAGLISVAVLQFR